MVWWGGLSWVTVEPSVPSVCRVHPPPGCPPCPGLGTAGLVLVLSLFLGPGHGPCLVGSLVAPDLALVGNHCPGARPGLHFSGFPLLLRDSLLGVILLKVLLEGWDVHLYQVLSTILAGWGCPVNPTVLRHMGPPRPIPTTARCRQGLHGLIPPGNPVESCSGIPSPAGGYLGPGSEAGLILVGFPWPLQTWLSVRHQGALARARGS